MIEKMEKLPSNLTERFPFQIQFIQGVKNKFLIKDFQNKEYHLYVLTDKEYRIYFEISKSSRIEKSIFEAKDNDKYYLLFPCLNKTSESLAICSKMLPLLIEFFDDFKYSIRLKKEHLVHLNHIYKVLDNKFTYFEMRIRELELNPHKNDIIWVVLSKYYILLDAKMYLYDLQQDIFAFIDKNIDIDYGVIFREVREEMFKNNMIEPNFDIYYGPIGVLLARYYLCFDHLDNVDFFKEHMKKLDDFNAKYFCFMGLYIYVLNLNLDIILNPFNIGNYLQITKKISIFIKTFGDYVKK